MATFDRRQKALILDQIMDLANCHFKHAIRLLSSQRVASSGPAAMHRRVYDEAVRQALIVLWEAADRICGKRLKAILPSLVKALEGHGHLALDLTDPIQAKEVLATIITWYNERRLHRALGFLPPADYYRGNPKIRHEQRRQQMVEARHRRKEKNLELRQRTIPFSETAAFVPLRMGAVRSG